MPSKPASFKGQVLLDDDPERPPRTSSVQIITHLGACGSQLGCPVTRMRGTLCRAHSHPPAQDLSSPRGYKEVCFVSTVSRRQIGLLTQNKKSRGVERGGGARQTKLALGAKGAPPPKTGPERDTWAFGGLSPSTCWPSRDEHSYGTAGDTSPVPPHRPATPAPSLPLGERHKQNCARAPPCPGEL